MKTQTSHFYVGHFPDEETLAGFVEESDSYYGDEKGKGAKKYISAFAQSQGERSPDLDFMESAFDGESAPFAEKFADASYSGEWMDELQRRIDALETKIEINSFIMINKEEIKHPVSVKTGVFDLLYMGEITYFRRPLF